MTLMINDLNDHHDRVVVVEVFVYDKKKQSLTLSRVPGFLLTSNPRYNPLTSFASLYKLKSYLPTGGKVTNNLLNLSKYLHFPCHCTRTEYGSRTTIKGRNKEFSLTLEGAEHVLIISLLDRFHDEVASLGQTTEEDESLW